MMEPCFTIVKYGRQNKILFTASNTETWANSELSLKKKLHIMEDNILNFDI